MRDKRVVAILLLLVVTAGVYLPAALTSGFVWEDWNATSVEATAAPPVRLWRVRAMTRVTYQWDRWMARNQHWATPYHLTNLALHLVNGTLVYALALTILPFAGAVIAAALFLLHPLNSEPVMYVAARTELLSTLFVLLALLLATRRLSWWVLLPLTLAVSAKESAVVGFLLVGWWLALHDQFPTMTWETWQRFRGAIAIATLVVVGILTTTLYYEYLPVGHSNLPLARYAALQATALGHYLAMVLWPVGQTLDHDYEILPVWHQWLGGAFWLGMLQLAGLGWILYRHWTPVPPRIRLACWGLIWVLLALAPRFVMKVPEVLNEHQVYLPFIGVWFALGGYLTLGSEDRVGRSADTRATFGVSYVATGE